eukprot:m.7321 g.7321  ORF g.7321 m.7321 type:complete len:74 (-) comp5162_c0_seq1:3725-3946(-)
MDGTDPQNEYEKFQKELFYLQGKPMRLCFVILPPRQFLHEHDGLDNVKQNDVQDKLANQFVLGERSTQSGEEY